MKTTLVLLWLLPIVAFAYAIPQQRFAREVQPSVHNHDNDSLLDKIREKLEADAAKLKEILEEKFPLIGKINHAIEERVKQLKAALDSALETVKDEIKDKVQQAKQDLDRLAQTVLGQERYEELKTKAQEIVQKVQYQLIVKLVEARNLQQQVEQAVGTQIAQLLEKYGELKGETKERIQQVQQQMKEKMQDAQAKLTQAEEELKQKLQQAQEELQHIKSDPVGHLKGALSQAEDNLRLKLREAQEDFAKIQEQVKSELQKIQDEIKHTVGK